MDKPDYKAVVRAEVFEQASFLKLTLSNKLRDDATPWLKLSVRPVAIKAARALQFSYFDGKKDVLQNFSGQEARARLDEALEMPFGQIHVQTTSGDIQVLLSRKGHVHISKSKPSRTVEAPALAHDRVKQQPLGERTRDPFLRALGIMNKSGKVRTAMRGKLNQINEFLRIIDQVLESGQWSVERQDKVSSLQSKVESSEAEQPERAEKQNCEPETLNSKLEIIDCGCGSAYLTFAAYHYLNDVKGLPAHAVGVDVSAELIAQVTRLRDTLGWDGLEFHVSSIADFRPARPPDVVLSLHACDTATDEALAQAVKWRSRGILAAPCCQHELHDLLKSDTLRPILRYGILRERQADIVTDTFRALALRIMGYRTNVIEFISPESTAKNLMIRAELDQDRTQPLCDPAFAREYNRLKEFWQVTPAIERLLGAKFERRLSVG